MSAVMEAGKSERVAIEERILEAASKRRDLEGSSAAIRKGPFGADAGPHKFDEAQACAALKAAPSYDDACYAYNAVTGAFLAPGDFQARCRNKGLAKPGGRAVPSPIPPTRPTPVATPKAPGKAARVPWDRSAMAAACAAGTSWQDATDRYNAATGQARGKSNFCPRALTYGFKLSVPVSRGPKPRSAPRAIATPAPPIAPEPIARPVPDRPVVAPDPSLGPFRPPAIPDYDWALFLAGVHLVVPLGIDPATLRRIADVLEATKGVIP